MLPVNSHPLIPRTRLWSRQEDWRGTLEMLAHAFTNSPDGDSAQYVMLQCTEAWGPSYVPTAERRLSRRLRLNAPLRKFFCRLSSRNRICIAILDEPQRSPNSGKGLVMLKRKLGAAPDPAPKPTWVLTRHAALHGQIWGFLLIFLPEEAPILRLPHTIDISKKYINI